MTAWYIDREDESVCSLCNKGERKDKKRIIQLVWDDSAGFVCEVCLEKGVKCSVGGCDKLAIVNGQYAGLCRDHAMGEESYDFRERALNGLLYSAMGALPMGSEKKSSYLKHSEIHEAMKREGFKMIGPKRRRRAKSTKTG